MGPCRVYRGYVKQSRAEMEAPIWDQSPLHWKVWLYLRMAADWQTGIVKRSYRGMAQDVMWTERGAPRVPDPRTIREIVTWFVEQGMVTVAIKGTGNAQYTEICICNFDTCEPPEAPESNAASTENLHTMSPSREVQEVLESRVPPPPARARARGHVGDWYNPSHPYGFPRAGEQEDWKTMLTRDAWERDLVKTEPDFDAQTLMLTFHRAGKSLIWTLSPDYAARVFHYLHRHPAFLSGSERLHMADLTKLNAISLKGGDKGPFIREPLDYFNKTRADDGRYRFQAILLYDEDRRPNASSNGHLAEDVRPRPKDLSATLHASTQRKPRD